MFFREFREFSYFGFDLSWTEFETLRVVFPLRRDRDKVVSEVVVFPLELRRSL